MNEALMFITYPNESGKGATLSVRSSHGHNPPSITKAGPEVQVLNTMVHEDGTYNVFLVCFACNKWKGTTIRPDSQRQPWIWAYGKNARSNDLEVPISRHIDYGLFFADMTSDLTINGPLLPQVEKSNKNRGIYYTDAESWISLHRSAIRALHGFLGLFAVVLLPIGIFRIRSSSLSAFNQHRAIQFGMTTSLTLASALGLLLTMSSNTYHGFHTSHQWLGLIVTLLIPGQIALGYRHHVIYMRTGEKSQASVAHIILGHYIWAFMTINAFLGLFLVDPGFNLAKALLLVVSCIPVFIVWFWEYCMWIRYTPLKPKFIRLDSEETRGLNESINLDD